MRLHSTWISIILFLCAQAGISSPQRTLLQHSRPNVERFRALNPPLGEISGKVTEASGGALPGVKVVLETPGSGERSTTTSSDGTFHFTNLPVRSDYRLRFLVPGFEALVRAGVAVEAKSTTSVNVVMLRPGQAAAVRQPLIIERTHIPPTASRPSSAAPPPEHVARAGTASAAPAEAPAPSSPDWDAIIGQEVAKLHEGKFVFNPPPSMRQGHQDRIEARISAQEIGSALTEGLKGSGVPSVESVKVGATMRVTLTAENGDFEITTLSDEEQTVAGRPYAQWDWDVTPLRSGERWLHLRVVAPIFVPGRGEKAYDFPAIDRPIRVQVDRWYVSENFVHKNWQWIFGTLLLPLVAWGWKLYGARRMARPPSG